MINVYLPGFSSGHVLVAVQGNNEVGCWNLESGGRHQVSIAIEIDMGMALKNLESKGR